MMRSAIGMNVGRDSASMCDLVRPLGLLAMMVLLVIFTHD